MEIIKGVGIFVGIFVGIVLFLVQIAIPIDAGHWAVDRFDQPYGTDVVVVRQDKHAKPLFICADGNLRAPKNCLDVERLLELARTHGGSYNPKRLAREGYQ